MATQKYRTKKLGLSHFDAETVFTPKLYTDTTGGENGSKRKIQP